MRHVIMVLTALLFVVLPATAQTTLEGRLADQFSDFNSLLVSTGVQAEIAKGEYTVLAPSNGAFGTFLRDLKITMDDVRNNQEYARSLVRYHIIAGVISADDLLAAGKATSLGGEIGFGYDEDISRIVLNNGQATIEKKDLYSAGGVVQGLDNVLAVGEFTVSTTTTQPAVATSSATPSQPAAANVAANPNPYSAMDYIDNHYAVMSKAIDAAGMRQAIDNGEYTVLVPNDGAFLTLAREMRTTVDELLANASLMQNIVKKHLIAGDVTAETLLSDGKAGTLVFDWDDKTDRIRINEGRATIEIDNIATDSGMVHVIDNVLR